MWVGQNSETRKQANHPSLRVAGQTRSRKSERSRGCLQLRLGWSATPVWRPLQIQLPRPWPSSPGGVFPLTCALCVWQSEWSEESSFPCRGLRPHVEAQLGQRGCHKLLLPPCSLSIPGCWKVPRAKQNHTVSGQCRLSKGGCQSMVTALFVKTLLLSTVSATPKWTHSLFAKFT